jgi:hypothetical protein
MALRCSARISSSRRSPINPAFTSERWHVGAAWGRIIQPVAATAKFVVTSTASAYLLPAMKVNPLPAGFVIRAQLVKAPKPPVGTDLVHEIKHDGC